RSGGKNRGPLFEGGQNPLWMRIPRRGFSNHRHRVAYQALPLARILSRVDGNDVSLEALAASGLSQLGERIKVVSPVAVDRAITLTAHRVSASVRQAIEAAGGSVTEIDAAPAAASGKGA
ncbi:MAG: 50S ribosomal protein L15, partial [Planctomycetota bacterium]